MKLFFCDVETTGVTSNSAIVQFAGIYNDTEKNIEEEINITIKPHDGADISLKAFEVNGLSEKIVSSYEDSKKRYLEILSFLSSKVSKFDKSDKIHFIAWNGLFDYTKLNEMFLRNGNKYMGSYFANPSIDLKQLVNLDLLKSGKRPSNGVGYFNLEFAMNHYGIKKPDGDLHDAMVDIRLTKLIWDHFFKWQKMDYVS